ncbi:hypothetical protein OCU04_007909 [Sclerotinia nivalis]|uniref:Uncharacterized protein n=1 Tax=Sclerotinia nivalis TaxID=352851 RepID=A0A9X0AKN6_9HELO|nr:hypothetical protein OCU04_007909 [Sclerotinia nivalis]
MYPLDKFGADRFLIHEDDSTSGPQKKKAPQVQAKNNRECESSPAISPKFSLAATDGSWLPYSSSARACFRQTIWKQAMLAACAIMITEFIVEILAGEEALEMDPNFYGLGGQQPMGKVPFRIRRKLHGSHART